MLIGHSCTKMATIDTLLLEFLTDLDNQLQKDIDLLVLGGNALIIYGCKYTTRDVDICVRGVDVDVYDWSMQWSKKNKVMVDVYIDGWFKNVRFPDYLKRSTHIPNLGFKHINIYLMNIYDMVLTKVDRWSDRDRQDINSLLRVLKIEKRLLDGRYSYYLKNFNGPEHEKQRFANNFGEFLNVFGQWLH